MQSKSKIGLLLLVFVFLTATFTLQAKTLKTPNQIVKFEVKSGKKQSIAINNGSNTQIGVKLNCLEIPDNTQILVHINGEVEEVNWQEGETYIFKTRDNSGHCVVDFIGVPDYGAPYAQLIVEVSYQVLPDGEFNDVDDQITYLKSILVAREDKYVGQPMSVLISDLDKYQLNIYEWIASGATIDSVKVKENKFQVIGIYFNPIVYISKHPEIKFLSIQVLLNQSYLDSELKVFLTDDDRGSWTQNSKNYLNNKIVKGLHITVYGN